MAADSTKTREDSTYSGVMVKSSIAMPQRLFDEIDRIAETRMSGRSTVIREAVVEFLTRQGVDLS